MVMVVQASGPAPGAVPFCAALESQAQGKEGQGCQDPSPEHHGVIEVADGGQAGHGPLRGKAGLHEGPRVEHAQESVDDDLRRGQWDPELACRARLPWVGVGPGPGVGPDGGRSAGGLGRWP